MHNTLPALSRVPQKQALCSHVPGLQPLLEAMPPAKSRAQQVRSQPEFARYTLIVDNFQAHVEPRAQQGQ